MYGRSSISMQSWMPQVFLNHTPVLGFRNQAKVNFPRSKPNSPTSSKLFSFDYTVATYSSIRYLHRSHLALLVCAQSLPLAPSHLLHELLAKFGFICNCWNESKNNLLCYCSYFVLKIHYDLKASKKRYLWKISIVQRSERNEQFEEPENSMRCLMELKMRNLPVQG